MAGFSQNVHLNIHCLKLIVDVLFALWEQDWWVESLAGCRATLDKLNILDTDGRTVSARPNGDGVVLTKQEVIVAGIALERVEGHASELVLLAFWKI